MRVWNALFIMACFFFYETDSMTPMHILQDPPGERGIDPAAPFQYLERAVGVPLAVVEMVVNRLMPDAFRRAFRACCDGVDAIDRGARTATGFVENVVDSARE